MTFTYLLLTGLNESPRVKQTGAYGCRFHQWTHLAEVEQEPLSGHNQPKQLKTHCCVVTYHLLLDGCALA